MGGKPERQRKHILLFPAGCLILLMIAGCGRLAGHPALPAAKERSVGSPIHSEQKTGPAQEQELEARQLLDKAEIFLESGKTAKALAAIGKVTVCCEGHFPQRALHLLTLVLSHPGSSGVHRNDTIHRYLQLEASYPEAVYGPAAECWLAALNEALTREAEIEKLQKAIQSQKRRIQTLERQIEQLKAVDLELEAPDQGGEMP